MSGVDSRFATDVAGAPEVLSAHARRYLEQATGSDHRSRLAAASRAALDAAIEGTPRRTCALDLLAADALITLALLETARESPTELRTVSRMLRQVSEGGG